MVFYHSRRDPCRCHSRQANEEVRIKTHFRLTVSICINLGSLKHGGLLYAYLNTIEFGKSFPSSNHSDSKHTIKLISYMWPWRRLPQLRGLESIMVSRWDRLEPSGRHADSGTGSRQQGGNLWFLKSACEFIGCLFCAVNCFNYNRSFLLQRNLVEQVKLLLFLSILRWEEVKSHI